MRKEQTFSESKKLSVPQIELKFVFGLANSVFKSPRMSEKAGGDQLPPLAKGKLKGYSLYGLFKGNGISKYSEVIFIATAKSL